MKLRTVPAYFTLRWDFRDVFKRATPPHTFHPSASWLASQSSREFFCDLVAKSLNLMPYNEPIAILATGRKENYVSLG